MSDKLVGQLLNDFVDLFQVITRTRDRKKAIYRINTGFCGMAAMAVGNVLIHGYDYDPKRVEWHSHCLHMWLRVDGVDYDTMFPQGYSRCPSEEWLLSDVHYNSSTMGASISSKEDNSGYFQGHLWHAQLLIEFFYERFGVTPPEYVVANRKKWYRDGDTKQWRANRRYDYRAKLARHLPLRSLTLPVEPTGVWPQTHYHFGEFEEQYTRKLRDFDFETRGVSRGDCVRIEKKLVRESREKGIHVRRL